MATADCTPRSHDAAAVSSKPPIIIRPATLDDVPGIAQVHVDVWRQVYPGLIPEEEITVRDLPRRTRLWTSQLALEGDEKVIVLVAEALLSASSSDSDGKTAEPTKRIVGFLAGGVSRSRDHPNPQVNTCQAELYAIYVDSSVHRRGVGIQLTAAFFEALHARKLTDGVMLWALDTNLAAQAFYRSIGAVQIPDAIKIEDQCGGITVCAFWWPSPALPAGIAAKIDANVTIGSDPHAS